MKYYAIGEFAKVIGVTEQTLRNWDKSNKLKPHHVAESGYSCKLQGRRANKAKEMIKELLNDDTGNESTS